MTLIPNRDAVAKHLERLFGGHLDGAHDGLVEIAWTDKGDGRLRHAEHFGTDALDEAVDKAVAVNADGCNVYVGAALRKPGGAPFGRADDADFHALPALYVDLDDVEAVKRAKQRVAACPPTTAVWTGRLPTPRLQLWWRLDAPERDPDVTRRILREMALTLGGDTTVTNPSRVMRLAGSIAWPKKAGRVAEMTELVEFKDGRPRIWMREAVERAFSAQPADAQGRPQLDLGLNALDPFEVARSIGPGNWHGPVLRLVGHLVGTGVPDGVVHLVTDGFTQPGYTQADTRREVQRMIDGARRKMGKPNSAISRTIDTLPFAAPVALSTIDPATIPLRPWVYGRRFARGLVTVTIAPAGVGKTTLTLHEAAAIATGTAWAGQAVFDPGNVWVYNNEDDLHELDRRMYAALDHMEIAHSTAAPRLFRSSGADRPLILARQDANGNLIRTPDVEGCVEHILSLGVRLFIVDPFAETHDGDENANRDVRVVGALYREIAQRGDCAVHIVHHTRKMPQAASDGHAGNMDTSRGASALVGVARFVHTLFGMSERDAERLGIDAKERYRYLRLDGAKSNLSLVGDDVLWFRREAVTIANGEDVGVLSPVEMTEAESAAVFRQSERHRSIIARLLAVVPDAMSVNQAGLVLIDQPGTLFPTYAGKDFAGKCPASVRREIEAAVAANVVVNGEGFTLEDAEGVGGRGRVRTLRRQGGVEAAA